MSTAKRHKRIARMHALRDQAARWAERNHPDELEQGIRGWLGPHALDERLFMQGVAYALVTGRLDGRASLLERFFVAQPPRSRVERTLVEAWRGAWFGVFELVEVVPGEQLVLEDVVTDTQFAVREASASTMLSPGQWGLFFVVSIDGHYELEGTTLLLNPTGRIAAVQAMLAGLEQLGLEPGPETLSPADTRRLAPDVVAAARHAERRPRFVNRDGHDLVVLRAPLHLAWSEFAAATEDWEDLPHHDPSSATWIGRHDEQLSGPLSLVSFNAEGPGEGIAVLSTNSFERLAAFRELWQERTGTALPVVEDDLEVEEVDSNPDGSRIEVDGSVVLAQDRDLEEAEEDFREHMAAHWIDAPTPALGGASPRQAVEAGRRAEVRALLPTELPEALLWELRDELDL